MGRRTYCVGYEYFLQVSRIHTRGGDTAGLMFSQLNYDAGQRVALTNGGDRVAAVTTGMDNHTSSMRRGYILRPLDRRRAMVVGDL